MPIDNAWLDQQAKISVDPNDLTDAGMRALCALANREDYQGANFIEARQNAEGSAQVVVFTVYVELGQKPKVNDINEFETIAAVIADGDLIPSVYAIRSDFPQSLPHMNLNFRGLRRSLCLFDASAQDVAHVYNPALLIERVRWWLSESAHGDLHGDEQPLDPAIAPSVYNLILPPDFQKNTDVKYTAIWYTEYDFSPIKLVIPDKTQDGDTHRYACSVVETGPVAHGSMLDLPSNMSELISTYRQLDVDIRMLLQQQHFKGDLQASSIADLLHSKLLLIIITPLMRKDGTVSAQTTRAFLSRDVTLLEIGLAIGLIGVVDKIAGVLLSPKEIDVDLLEKQMVLPVNIVYGFSEKLALLSSGLKHEAPKGSVSIGAGALGSQVVMNCARMGHSSWTVVDNDFILPHNLARHSAPGWMVGQSKAVTLSESINALFEAETATAIHEAFGTDSESKELAEALARAGQIIDLSASLDVSRCLSARDDIKSPITSYFVNPAGTALIQMRECDDRSVSITDVEMSYYWLIYDDPKLHSHLSVGDMVRIGSCRSASVTIPQHRMAMFAAIASGKIVAGKGQGDSGFTIWTTDVSGAVEVREVPVPEYVEQTHGNWKVSVSTNVSANINEARVQADLVETGGILLGSCDRKNKRIYISGAMRQPKDSRAGSSYFERGGTGVVKMIEDAEHRTMKHLTYIGEWHTHPAGIRNRASYDDDKLLYWIAEQRELFVMPGVMLILGENGFRLRTKESGEILETEF